MSTYVRHARTHGVPAARTAHMSVSQHRLCLALQADCHSGPVVQQWQVTVYPGQRRGTIFDILSLIDTR